VNGVGIGHVVRTVGDLLAVALPAARLGEGVHVQTAAGALRGRVSAVESGRVIVAPFGGMQGVAVGDRVETSPDALSCIIGYGALGRAFDPLGTPIDRDEPMRGKRVRVTDSVSCLARLPVTAPFWTGVRALDGLLTIGRGARVGLFGAPGAGKTMLLESIARGARGDAVVVALIGERGREAAGWLRRTDARTTIVCATADRPASERVRAAEVAMAQATTLREAGLHVVLIVDSLARYATALRELRTGLGEPVGRGGYPPSVLAALGRYLERAGATVDGSITVIATVLSDGADEREPLSDAARAALDGHIALSTELARAGRFPAIDVLASASRTMRDVVSEEHQAAADVVRAALAILSDTRDLRTLGLATAPDPALARAVAAEPALTEFLVQRDPNPPPESVRRLIELAAALAPA
jgi:ATP synthase in type III secretion protein N